jgi:hypothetical protein
MTEQRATRVAPTPRGIPDSTRQRPWWLRLGFEQSPPTEP